MHCFIGPLLHICRQEVYIWYSHISVSNDTLERLSGFGRNQENQKKDLAQNCVQPRRHRLYRATERKISVVLKEINQHLNNRNRVNHSGNLTAVKSGQEATYTHGPQRAEGSYFHFNLMFLNVTLKTVLGMLSTVSALSNLNSSEIK